MSIPRAIAAVIFLALLVFGTGVFCAVLWILFRAGFVVTTGAVGLA